MYFRKAKLADLETIISWIPDESACKIWAGPMVKFPLSIESLSKDIYVEEALNILNDMQPKSSGKAAANVQKAPLQKTK